MRAGAPPHGSNAGRPRAGAALHLPRNRCFTDHLTSSTSMMLDERTATLIVTELGGNIIPITVNP